MVDATDPDGLDAAQILDIDRNLERLDNEAEFLKEILALFLVDGQARADKLEEALDTGDLGVAAKAAHSLKGMCGTINAPALMEMALHMEIACRSGNDDAARALLPALQRHLEAVKGRIGAYLESGQGPG